MTLMTIISFCDVNTGEFNRARSNASEVDWLLSDAVQRWQRPCYMILCYVSERCNTYLRLFFLLKHWKLLSYPNDRIVHINYIYVRI